METKYDKCQKKGYANRSEAKKALKQLKKKRPTLTTVYKCQICECFHLTSITKKSSRSYTRALNKRKTE